MTAAFTYSSNCLNDNWLEDRLADPTRTPRATPRAGASKTVRPYETDIAYIGDRYAVLSRIARSTERKSFALPDDGFNEKLSLAATDYADPRKHPEFVNKPPEKPRFLTEETVPEVCSEERRPVDGPRRGFGAVLNRHPEGHDRRYWSTTHGEVYGKPEQIFTPRRNPASMHPSGRSSELVENSVSGVKCGRLCGEDYRESTDPALDTRTQRAWLYSADPSVSNVHLGGSKMVALKPDNFLSLPLGDGAQKKIRQDLAERRGMLYRTATHITKGAGAKPGIAVFQDYVEPQES